MSWYCEKHKRAQMFQSKLKVSLKHEIRQ